MGVSPRLLPTCQSARLSLPLPSAQRSPAVLLDRIWRKYFGKRSAGAAVFLLGLSVLPKAACADGLEGLGILLDGGCSYDSNLTNASNPADKRADSALALNFGVSKIVALTDNTRLALRAFIEGKGFARYDGLDRVSADAEVEYMYRPSGEFAAPTFGMVTGFGRDEFRSDLRKNDHYSAGATLRQLLIDRISIFAALKDNVSHGDNDVFGARYKSTQSPAWSFGLRCCDESHPYAKRSISH